MKTCEQCKKIVKDGQFIDHWICADCKIMPEVEEDIDEKKN